MNPFEENLASLYKEFNKGKKMVLSTSFENRVTSRMMSVICMEGKFYFQTDRTFRKYKQIENNPSVALCIDNIQIEGVCREIGLPKDNDNFCRVFEKCFKGSYDMYSMLEDERVFEVNPGYIERWVYQEGIPFIETFDFVRKEHKMEKYTAI